MSSTTINRRQFLRLSRNAQAQALRPPWSLHESAFQDACTRCGDCITACPENIVIREGVNGYPRIDFQHGECTFCGDCAQACPSHALELMRTPAWSHRIKIGEGCLSYGQVICSTCAEQCEAGAIRFQPQRGSVPVPEINIDACNGCGACVAPCPVQAIEVI